MTIALRELLRRPGRFVPVVGALTLLVLLLVVLGGFLDGLTLGATGALRAQGDVAIVSSADAELLGNVSVLDPEVREEVANVPGVAEVGGFARITTTASVGGDGEVVDVVVAGYDLAAGRLPGPPGDGGVLVAESLADLTPVAVGDVVLVGPRERELRVEGFVEDAADGSPTLWLGSQAWRALATEAAPTSPLTQGGDQLLVVVPEPDTDAAALAAKIPDAVTGTAAGTVDDAVAALPAVTQQAGTFQGIIAVTFVVALIVVGLFFVLLTLERLRLYAVLKALGGRTWDLLAGLAAQALGIAAVSLVLGLLLALGLTTLLPPDLPVRLLPGRLAALAVGTLVTALVAALATLRRLLRIDPAEAIG